MGTEIGRWFPSTYVFNAFCLQSMQKNVIYSKITGVWVYSWTISDNGDTKSWLSQAAISGKLKRTFLIGQMAPSVFLSNSYL